MTPGLSGAHDFHHRRVRNVPDSRPKTSGYWPSELAVANAIMGKLFHGADEE